LLDCLKGQDAPVVCFCMFAHVRTCRRTGPIPPAFERGGPLSQRVRWLGWSLPCTRTRLSFAHTNSRRCARRPSSRKCQHRDAHAHCCHMIAIKASKPARTEHLPNARLVLGVLERRAQLIVVDERRRVPSIRRKTPPLGPSKHLSVPGSSTPRATWQEQGLACRALVHRRLGARSKQFIIVIKTLVCPRSACDMRWHSRSAWFVGRKLILTADIVE